MVGSEKKRRIGLFGGTFDPVHKGHLAVARGVVSRYGLDECIFIPAPYPPHKNKPQTGFSHRIAMLEAALEDEPKCSVSLIEAERQYPSYTVDTLHALRNQLGEHVYNLIIGADSFVEIHLWYRYQELLELTDIIVAARPGISDTEIAGRINTLPGGFQHDRERGMWLRDDGLHIYYFSDIHVDLSSSEIRKRLASGHDVQEFLPPKVFKYIQENRLYTTSG